MYQIRSTNMLYLVGLIIPPLGVFLCGRPFQAIFNFTLLVLGLLIFVGTLGSPMESRS
jgi:uncharacterized membrane protein YqaE (UPF0057 family)